MNINVHLNATKLANVINKLAPKVSSPYVEAAIVIGKVDNRVYQLKIMSAEHAHYEDIEDGPAWAECITTDYEQQS